MSAHSMVDGKPCVFVDEKWVPIVEHMRGAIEKAIFLANCDGAVTLFDTFMVAPTNYNPGQDKKEQPKNSAALREAVARGWTHSKNAHKEMDADLAEAITEELSALPSGKQHGQPKTDLCVVRNFLGFWAYRRT